MSGCEFCDHGLVEYCDARDPRHGFVCTRPAGHDGPHVACAPSDRAKIDDHEVAEWTDDEVTA